MNRIKVFIMDVDGTMTDGKIYMGAGGELMKAFDIKDGYAIHELLPENGVCPVIMTGRVSDIVTNRAKELEVPYVMQGIKDKRAAVFQLMEQLDCSAEEAAYMGDDLIDLEAMRLCGTRGCPADAVPEIKAICSFISTKNGGSGAVREFAEWILGREDT